MSEIYCHCCRKHKKPECFTPTDAKNGLRRNCKICTEKMQNKNTFPNGIAKTDETKIAVNKKRSANSKARFNAFLKTIEG